MCAYLTISASWTVALRCLQFSHELRAIRNLHVIPGDYDPIVFVELLRSVPLASMKKTLLIMAKGVGNAERREHIPARKLLWCTFCFLFQLPGGRGLQIELARTLIFEWSLLPPEFSA